MKLLGNMFICEEDSVSRGISRHVSLVSCLGCSIMFKNGKKHHILIQIILILDL